MNVYLIRHGQTKWNVESRIQGFRDIELDETGLRQSQAVVEKLKQVPIDIVYSSPLLRARVLSEMISKQHQVVLHLDERWRELHAGDFEGWTWAEVEKHHLGVLKAIKQSNFTMPLPNGESLTQLQQRAIEAFQEVLSQHHQNVVIVSHGGTIKALLCALLQVSLEQRDHFIIENGSIIHLKQTSDGWILHSIEHIE